jgi:hypothetical protein
MIIIDPARSLRAQRDYEYNIIIIYIYTHTPWRTVYLRVVRLQCAAGCVVVAVSERRGMNEKKNIIYNNKCGMTINHGRNRITN